MLTGSARDLAPHTAVRRRSAWLLVLPLLAAPLALAAAPTAPARPPARRHAPPGPPAVRASHSAIPVRSAQSAIPGPDALMPVSELKPGMKGYGLTVFKGTKIERFNVTILGVLPAANMGKPLVLIRMAGGPITGHGAYLIKGMSGSPVYVNDRLVGAFAYGDAFAKEPIGMVTPIQDMMEALNEKLPAEPVGMASVEVPLPAEVAAGTGPYRRLFLGPDEGALPAGGGTLGMAPLATPVIASGFSARTLPALGQLLKPFNLSVQVGGGRMEKPVTPAPTLGPGSGIGVQLISGDMDLTAVGTVTWRKGDKILAFGHPFMQIGPAQFPVTTVWVHDVFASFQNAFKIASPVEPVGTLLHDRPFCVLAKAGPTPEMVPVTCNIDDRITGRVHVFRVKVANHPLLLGQLAQIALNEAVAEAHPVPGDVTADVRLALQTESFGRLGENTFYDPTQIEAVATQELGQMMSLLAQNSLRRVPVKALEVNVTLAPKRPTATIERIWVKQDRFEPGETAEVGIVIRPYRAEPVTTRASIQIPENAASGRAILMVSGGAARIDPTLLAMGGGDPGGAPAGPAATAGAAHVAQLLRRFLEREKNNQLVTRIIFPTAAVSVDGVKVSQLPGSLVEVMRSSRATGLRVERDEVKTVDNTEYLLQGAQALSVTIQRKELAEKPPSDPGGIGLQGSGSGGIELGGLGTPRNGLSLDDPDADVDRAHLPPRGYQPEKADRFFRMSPDSDDRQPRLKPGDVPPLVGPKKPEPNKPEVKADGKPDGKGEAAKESPGVPVDSAVLIRQPVTWKQTTLADFQRGTLAGTAVTASGEVRLAPALKPLFESSEQYIWSLVASGDAVFAGTGNAGQIYRVAPDGKAEVFANTGELEVHTLAKDAHGNLYAGTSPTGKVLRLTPDGKATSLLTLSDARPEAEAVTGPPPAARYVLALAVASDGTVFAGTGPEGKLYRISPDGQSTVLFTAKDRSIVSLLLGPQGEIYAGTSDGGLVYRIEPSGKGQALLDTDQSAITGLARDSAGNLYAATAPKGTIYRIRPDGAVQTYFDRAKGPVSALAMAKGDVLYAACGNVIYRLDSEESVTALSDSKRAQFMAIGWDSQGRLVAASANVGAVYRAEPGAVGAFESTVHDAKTVARWGRIRWTAVLSSGAQLLCQTRSGNTPEPDATWSDWATPRTEPSGTFVTSPPARYLQYRIILRSSGGVAGLRELSLIYLPRNEPPTLTFSAPAGSEIWRGTQTLRWTGADPNKDTLTYEVSYSPDGGQTWRPVGEQKVSGTPGYPAPSPNAEHRTPNIASVSADELEAALELYRQEIVLRQDLSDETRRDLIARAEELVDSYKEENPGATSSPPAKSGPAPAAEKKPTPPAKPGVTRESSLAWDTTQIPDGIYLLRVVATDRASNPGEPLSVTKVSEPVIVVNQPPVIYVPASAIQYTSEKQAVVTGLCQSRVTLKGAQFRVDEGEWVAIDAADGIWDSSIEQWRLTTDSLKSGDHTLQVKTVDLAGNVTVTQAKLTVP